MKVLFITRKWSPAVGGMETYCRELTDELKNRVDLDLITLPGRPDGRRPTAWSLCRFGVQAAISVIISKSRYDVVHGGDLALWPLIWLATLRYRSTIAVLSAHGTDIALAHREGLRAWIYRRYIGLARRLLPTSAIVANSNATAVLCTNIGFSSVDVVPLATRLRDIHYRTPEPYVLFVGRLIPSKGCAWFVDNVLPRLEPQFRLFVAGTIWNEKEAQSLKNERVEFLGPVTGNQLDLLRETATAIIVPNIDLGINGFEGFGLSTTEGAAAGGVVLASRLHGICDAVTDGLTGFLLSPGDAQTWIEKIREVAQWTPDQRSAFVKNSREAIKHTFSWSRVADQTLRAYELRRGKDRA